ncbi:MAG: rod shape-determining protein RodA [Nitrospirae bacterium]|nr:rod shape-determining protein RodA [Nitrospirota bacterium]
MLDIKQIYNFEWKFLGLILLISGIGILTIFSATYGFAVHATPYYQKQLYWIAIGLMFLFLASAIDYHTIIKYGYVIYAVTIILLIVVLIKGRTGLGAQRWLSLGFFSFQPSELAKIAIIVLLSRYFSDKKVKAGFGMKDLLLPAILLLVPVGLILKQPDLGTALLLSFIFLMIILLAGIRLQTVLTTLFVCILTIPFIAHYFWGMLKGYQKNRILAFFDPEMDPQGIGYHIIQSKIAIGSGGLFGKGLLQGTQNKLKFIPEKHTDFIFSVFAEEWGFIGALILLTTYLVLILWGITIAYKAKDREGALLAAGVVCMLSFYLIVNVGMTAGIMPVVGIPLPLMSYGGTSIITTMVALGLLINVKMRRLLLFY